MKKTAIALGLYTLLNADTFESFLDNAVKNSPYLKAIEVQILQSKKEGERLMRYKNPNVELEGSYFDQNSKDGALGFRLAYDQPIRLWGVGDNAQALSSANVALAQANYMQAKASYIRDISLQYTEFVQSELLSHLALEERELAQTISQISTARYEAGTVTRGVMLQARIDEKMVLARLRGLELVAKRNYYALLKNAGITQELKLESDAVFEKKNLEAKNPELIQLSRRQKSVEAQTALVSNKIEWMNLVAEYENEPGQGIFRFGAVIPLAVFNTRSQEREVANLENSRNKLLSQNLSNQLKMELKRLNFEHESLVKLQTIDEEILKDEEALLNMYEEGYKIANVNLLALQDAKSRLIETKERLIKIRIELNRNAIIQNYLEGNYND